MFELVLITNLGLVTHLAHYNTLNECLTSKAAVQDTKQSSAQCLPVQDAQSFKREVEKNNQITNEALKRVAP